MITALMIWQCDEPSCQENTVMLAHRFGPGEKRVAEANIRMVEHWPEGWTMHSDAGIRCPEHNPG